MLSDLYTWILDEATRLQPQQIDNNYILGKCEVSMIYAMRYMYITVKLVCKGQYLIISDLEIFDP